MSGYPPYYYPPGSQPPYPAAQYPTAPYPAVGYPTAAYPPAQYPLAPAPQPYSTPTPPPHQPFVVQVNVAQPTPPVGYYPSPLAQMQPAQALSLADCPKCSGKGGYGAFGPCEMTDVHYRRPCSACNGTRKLDSLAVPCPKCKAKGGLGPFGPCEIDDVHYRRPCPTCKGKCYFESIRPSPLHPPMQRKLTMCPKCQGKGGMGAFGPCESDDVHMRGPCPECNGACYL